MPTLNDCIVLHGPDLEPYRCREFSWAQDRITRIELGEPCGILDGRGDRVIIPGLYNSHTHMGDSALPDGATGLTLEEGFFRPHGYKYRELAKLDRPTHLAQITDHLRYMAQTGTVCHLDFREQASYGARLLREASETTGVQSIILGQFDQVPFNEAELLANTAAFSVEARTELTELLAIADGFSESTMNDLTDAGWREIRELTTTSGQLRAIHCLENAGYRDRALTITGKPDLVRALETYDPHLIVHLTVANAEEVALMAHSGKTGVLNPRANANLGLPLPPIAALMRAGVNLLLGTDNGMLNSPSMLAELDFTYKVAKSQFGDAVQPDPAKILRMATSNIRSLLGGDHYGYLGEGLPATFCVMDFSQPHLRHSRQLHASILTRVTPADILATWRAGRCLWTAA